MSSSLLFWQEDSSWFNHVFSSSWGPWDVVGVPLTENGNLLTVDDLQNERRSLQPETKIMMSTFQLAEWRRQKIKIWRRKVKIFYQVLAIRWNFSLVSAVCRVVLEHVDHVIQRDEGVVDGDNLYHKELAIYLWRLWGTEQSVMYSLSSVWLDWYKLVFTWQTDWSHILIVPILQLVSLNWN